MSSSSNTGLSGSSLLPLGSPFPTFTARISSAKTSCCACLMYLLSEVATSSGFKEPSLRRSAGKRQFSMKRSTLAVTLASLLQLEYLCGFRRSSLAEARNVCTPTCSVSWHDLRTSISGPLLTSTLFSGHSVGSYFRNSGPYHHFSSSISLATLNPLVRRSAGLSPLDTCLH